ncbi:MAG: 4-hydroxy-tetrahydrodipicolinate reductase [Oscillospiraceae bacterium]|nr:4-hydroxy-tetrahydrodipicolinate reductase [Oscillospiraceae bacterium]
MINVILSGCNGYMGRVITELTDKQNDITITAGIDIDAAKQNNYPVYTNPNDIPCEIKNSAGVIIDFSSPTALTGLLELSISQKIPVILCATGYSEEQLNEIDKASAHTPVFRSGNMSLGINLLIDLIKRACPVLGEDFDVEIIEKHHRRKKDAPSGTALMLADAAAEAKTATGAKTTAEAKTAAEAKAGKPAYVYERQSKNAPREKNEIGISSVRGGTIVGEHDVIFAGLDEVIELRHKAASRDVFATGALKAARFMIGKPPGMYNMNNVLE